MLFSVFFAKVFNYLERASNSVKEKEYRRKFNISPQARLGYIPHIIFQGNIEIGEYSYFNSGKILSGKNSNVKIGSWCAIGYNVNIHAITHDSEISTGPLTERPLVEKSVVIGDHVWIGSNVFILPGVNIGSNCIIGANSVVVHDVDDNSIVGGIPTKLIRYKINKQINKIK